ncbi:putative lipoprotein YiaD [Vibrio crassostreae]|nr:outer membrane protein OmpA-like peptidoglycan-associated protein [Vibrio crassostreae]ROO64568.1 outer membrane protein OmpA-like peptidoglycan-associated protein [Vibrio crassostreae]ROR69820.1 outer membrane protein OmpA-like peptidoglycan-associated protein [Vibrio crassostreae]ROR86096.1 outer membrane protein OmpA-like peptidoglycan-associated protein [Vibrio crassostreae]TCV18169.1 outer membrane protein OmpA-like peptidoglycan-associated protein [Vibrio crassostreae]
MSLGFIRLIEVHDGENTLKKITLALALTIALTGCQATQRQNATTGESETNSATQGALIGALAGAVAGAATGDSKDRGKRALIGAAGGAAVGGGIGYYFDRQEAALREELMNSGVQVERVGENQLLLRLENGIGFDSGSYALESSIHNTLRGVARILVEYPDTSLVIEGHTDSTGSESTNQNLSERRAESVRAFLISQDVAAGRAIARGNGERYPLCDNNTSQGRACNRRVEIQILPLK